MLITTSRRTTRRINRLAKELTWVIPRSMKINRGKKSLEDLRLFMIRRGYTRLIIIEGTKGNPSKLVFYSAGYKALSPIFMLQLKGVSLQVDIKTSHKFSELHLKHDETAKSKLVYKYLNDFLSPPILDPLGEGGKGKMIIKEDGETPVIVFRDSRGRYIPPKLELRGLVDFESGDKHIWR